MKPLLAFVIRPLVALVGAGLIFGSTARASSLSVSAGQTVQLAVAAQGSQPFSYKWQKNGTAISGATSATYTIAAATTADSATYSATVSNSVGSIVSDNATLTVNAVTVIAPAITSQPASLTVTAGQAASFSVAASGTAPLTYQWKKSGTAISGATGATYTIAATTSSSAGSYSVTVTNSAGSATSNAATLTVNAAAAAPAITSQPASLTVTAGQAASFSVAASGTSPFTYQWKKSGTAISGATSATYTIAATTSASAGSYSVTVTNSAGSATSNAATLTVNAVAAVAPTITTQPAPLTVTAGQAASFSVVASGTGPLTYQWKKGGTAISGASSATYTIAATTSADGATYSVTVTNSAGSITSNTVILTVNPDLGLVELIPQSYSARGQNTPAEGIAQLFDGQASTKWLDFSGTTWVQIKLAAPASLQAYGLTSANDVPTRDPISWTLSGSNDGTTWTVIEKRTAQSWDTRFLTRDFILATPSAAYSQFRFDFVATSGSITQLAELDLFGLTGAALPVVPTITKQPVSITVTASQSVSFSVTASGTATLKYQWRKNGTAITGATSAAYTIASATSTDAASYSVVVSNSAGSVTSSAATLTVYASVTAPSITSQPAALAVTAGQPASLTVSATGTGPLSYQWKKNGTAVTGATSATYTIAATTNADAASYSVVVSNSAGSVTSSTATLTINAETIAVADLTPKSYSASGENSASEGIAKLFDGQSSTKWLDVSATHWVKVVFAKATVLQAYSLTSANDVPARDPASWTLSGSNDGTTWTVIETRTAQSWSSRLLTRDFVLAKPSAAYTQFRFDLQPTVGSIIQLADLELLGSTP